MTDDGAPRGPGREHDDGPRRRRGPDLSPAARRAVAAMLGLAALRAAGWILLAESLARLLTRMADTLDPEGTAQLFEMLFLPPAPVGPVGAASSFAGALALGAAGVGLSALADAGQRVWGRRAALGVQVGVRRDLVAHRLASADGSRPRSGADAVLVTHGLQGLDDYYTEVLPALASAAVVPPVLGAWILTRDPLSALVVLLTVPLVPFFMVLIGRHTQERIDAAQDGLDRLSGHLVELARGLPVLVGLRRAGVQRRALERASQRYHAATLGTLRTAFVSGMALELIASLSVAVMAVFIGLRLVYGQMDLGAGLVVLVLAAEVYLPLRDVGSAYHASEDGREAEGRARAAARAPVPEAARDALADPTAAPARAADPAAAPPGAVHLEDVGVAFGDRRVLQGVDLRAAPGTLTVLGSASGTGKSTLLHLLAGLLRTTDARVQGSVSGVDPDRTVWVGQHPRLLEPTVGEELDAAAGRALADSERAAVLAAVALDGAAHRRPVELSPGELRRVALARALARLSTAGADRRPWLVLLDEPTAHLDDAAAAAVRAGVVALARAGVPGLALPPCIVVAASHDPALQRAADALVDAQGTPLAPAGAAVGGAADPEAATTAAVALPAAVASPVEAEPVPASATSTAPSPAAARRARTRAALRILPWRSGRLWAGVAWATGTHLSAALLAGLSGWLIVTAAGRPPVLYLLSVIVLVRAFGLSRAVFRYLDRLATHDAVLGWASRLRLRLWDALGRRPALWGRLSRADGALSVLVADVDALRDAAPRVMVPVPAAVLAWLVSAGAVALLAPELAVAALVPGALGLVAIPVVVAALDRRQTQAAVRHRAGLLDRVAAVLAAAPDLHGLGRARAAADRLAEADAALQAPQRRAAWAAGAGRALAVLVSGGTALAVALTATQTGTAAAVAAFAVLLVLSWAEPYGALAQSAQELGTLASQARAAADLLGEAERGTAVPDAADPGRASATPDPTSDPMSADPEPAAPVRVTGLVLRGAAVRFEGADAPLWSGVDLCVEPGQTAVVTGPSGAGKSTLLAVLLGFQPLAEGAYLLRTESDGRRVEAPADAAALARVAWTPQDALLFDSTLRGNLALARDPEDAPDDAELTAVLERVGLGPWLAAAPEGLDTPVGAGGRVLSGGQRQRLAVARALVARADVVLLDEPTAHVGQDEALALMADLRAALAGRIAVVVTHDERLAAEADVRLRLGVSPPRPSRGRPRPAAR
ncbi:thiol reductant ABC exporter subunit CydC [Micrococcus endophyticus]|uniref:thiol reductant ABC exporter subunit CydC n=1 Tax=Micrococcus endophyticus TaxID=455343 RepID=UPI002005AF3B